MAGETGVERFRRAIAGQSVMPRVAGVTFVDHRILPGGDGAADPAEHLAMLCRTERFDFAFVEQRLPWSRAAVGSMAAAGVASAWVVDGVLWPALAANGLPAGLRAVGRAVEEIAPLLDRALERSLAAAAEGIEAGATALVVADDMAGSAGPLVDPVFIGAQVFPRLARIVESARAAGVPAILHCDGDARSLLSYAAGAGFAAIHGDAGGARGLASGFGAAREAGLTFIGGVPTAEISGAADGDSSCWRGLALARGGGLLLADDGGITSAVELESLLTILRALRADLG